LNGLRNLNTATSLWCYAPLQLPHGATITNATFYFYDNENAGSYFDFYMIRANTSAIIYNIMGWVDDYPGSDAPGFDHLSFSSVSYATVDNNNYYYYLIVIMPQSSISSYNYQFHYALVEYEYPA